MGKVLKRTAKLVRAWRRTNNVTQAELAEKLDISKARLEDIESERTDIDLELLILIRDVTGIDFEDMLSPMPETCIVLNENLYDTNNLLERLTRIAEKQDEMQSDADRWCAGCLPRTIKNPLKIFEEEYKHSLIGDICNPRLDPNSRLGKMTNNQYNQYANITKTLSEIWGGEMELTRDQFVDAVMRRFGTFPRELKILISNGITKEHEQLKTTTRDIQSKYAKNNRRLFAGGHLSPNELVQFDEHGRASSVVHTIHALDETICRIYHEHKDAFARDRRHFLINPDGSLCDISGEVFIDCENDDNCTVTDRFYIYLGTMRTWKSLADGVLEDGLRQELTS